MVDIATDKDLEVFQTHAYGKWKSLMNRVEHSQNYTDVQIAEEWLLFDNFKVWLDGQDYEDGWHLDKDLLSIDNLIYGPDTCIMIPPEVNLAIKRPKIKNDGLPTGVCETFINNKKIYKAVFSGGIIGYFDDVDSAFSEYLKYKSKEIIVLAEMQSVKKIKESLIVYANNLASGNIKTRTN